MVAIVLAQLILYCFSPLGALHMCLSAHLAGVVEGTLCEREKKVRKTLLVSFDGWFAQHFYVKRTLNSNSTPLKKKNSTEL